MMTVADITEILKKLEANYGKDFYDGTDRTEVLKLWASDFSGENPAEVAKAVKDVIDTFSFRPRIADIRKRMSANRMKGQMTSIEAFNEISLAVEKSYDRESAARAFNELPPILRKLTGFPSRLVSWHRVSDEAFQTVIMSAIRESYKELAQRESEYYAQPEITQKTDIWKIGGPEQVALPEPEKHETYEEIQERMNMAERYYREKYGIGAELSPENSKKVSDFLQPMTSDELKIFGAKQKRKEAERLERLKG